MATRDHVPEPLDAGARIPGGRVLPAVRGGCRIHLDGALEPAALASILAQVAGYPLDDARVVSCDVSAISHADAGIVDTLARLSLGLKRQGRVMILVGSSRPLRALLVFCGLDDVLLGAPGR